MHQMLAVALHKQAQEQLQCETTAALLVNVPGQIVRRSLQKTAVTTNSHTVHRNQEMIIVAMDRQIAQPNQELVVVAACAARGRGQFRPGPTEGSIAPKHRSHRCSSEVPSPKSQPQL